MAEETPSPADVNFAKNAKYAKAPGGDFQTYLSAADEAKFQMWVKRNAIPFDPSPKADYDMRGFYAALQKKDPAAKTAVNPNDNRMHFPDTWKTPYHQSFSNESKFADPAKAPKWNERDQLVDPTTGAVVFDERAKYAGRLLGGKK